MPIKITGNGTKHIPSLKSYIGKDANEAINQIQEISKRVVVTDCIGYNGHRIVTLMGNEKRIEIVCETNKADDVLNESIDPSEAEWRIIDIFEFSERPIPKKGYY